MLMTPSRFSFSQRPCLSVEVEEEEVVDGAEAVEAAAAAGEVVEEEVEEEAVEEEGDSVVSVNCVGNIVFYVVM